MKSEIVFKKNKKKIVGNFEMRECENIRIERRKKTRRKKKEIERDRYSRTEII